MSGATRLDLHVHSTFSPDGRSSVAELVGSVSAAGLDGFALTDHNSTAGHGELARLQADHPGLLLVPGVEVSTREGHLLVYGLHEPPPAGRPLEETVDWALTQGGEPVLSHPFRWPHGAGRHLAPASRIRALEAINGHSSRGVNARAATLARERRLPTTGGSDAHAAAELGRARTVLPEGAGSLEDFLEALRRGRIESEGSSLGQLEWLGWGVRAALARVGRGLRSI